MNENQRISVPFNSRAWDHIDTLTQDDRDTLAHFHLSALNQRLTAPQIGKILGYDRTTAHKIVSGTYTAKKWDNILLRIREHNSRGNLPIVGMGGVTYEPAFVETAPARTYLQAIDYASRGGFSLIAGESGSGKNKTAHHWASQHHGRLLPVTAPPLGAATGIVHEMAERIGMSHARTSVARVYRGLRTKLNSRIIIWVDEAGRLLPNRKNPKAPGLEVLRDLSDEIGCGVVVNMTWRNVESMSHLAYQIEQTVSRAEIFRAPQIQPDQVRAIAAQFGEFTDATHAALYDLAISLGGLRNVTKVLNLALRASGNDLAKITDQKVAGAIRNRFQRMGGTNPFS